MYPPAVLGREKPIAEALKESHELADAYQKEPEAKEIVDTAKALEGLRREDSVHAAGVVIGDQPLVNYLPLKLMKHSKDDSRRIVTQFDMHGVEKLGLLKMDFLGLRNLSVIEDTVGSLRKQGIELDIDHIPLDDEPTFDMLRRGDTTGVFQLEGGGMRSLIRDLAPDRFEDIMALNALYRPGPLNQGVHLEYAARKQGRKPVEFPHPDLEEILGDTYGVMVYQEQVMQIAVRLSGYTLGEADTLRKAIGKKKRDEMALHERKFVEGAVGRGYSERLARAIWDKVVPFADYGFNASHACAYALVGYQTAYLKAHHPTEYMAAILTSCKDDKDKKPFYLNACRLMGIEVLPPDVNESELDFTPREDGRIRYGLSAVRNVGTGVVQLIRRARAQKGRFESFTDFCRKVDSSVLHKKCVESLVLAGAFDSLGYTRRGLLENFEKVVTPIVSDRRAEAQGQESFFGGDVAPALEIDETVLQGEEFDRSQLLREEKGVLGQYVTDHPLLGVKDKLDAQVDFPIVEVPEVDGEVVTVGGIVGAVGRRYTKKGDPYAMFRLEDLAGGITIIAFPSVYEKVPGVIESDEILLVKGRVDLRGRELQLAAIEISRPDLSTDEDLPKIIRSTDPVVVDVPAESCTAGMLAKLRETLAAYPGSTPVMLRVLTNSGVTTMKVGDGYRVDGSEGLLSELRRLLGRDHVRAG